MKKDISAILKARQSQSEFQQRGSGRLKNYLRNTFCLLQPSESIADTAALENERKYRLEDHLTICAIIFSDSAETN